MPDNDKLLSIPPGLREAWRQEWRTVFLEVLQETNLVDLQKCRDDLKDAIEQFRNAAQKAETWQKIAELQGEKIDQLKAKVAQLEEANTERHAQVVSLMAELGKVSRKP